MMSTSIQKKSGSLAEAVYGERVSGRSWTLASAYEFCEHMARSHYENFPVGSLLVPGHLRKHFFSIYAFARTADDFADEGYEDGYSQNLRLELLQSWREMLGESFHGRANHPIFIALGETASKFELPRELFEDLISAFIQDVTVSRYESFEALLDYCRRSANPIGRLILLLFGHRDPDMHARSDDICTALQLANHWQDVAIDLDKDRVYLPMEDLKQFRVSVEDLKQRNVTDDFQKLMEFEVARARSLFARGKPLCTEVRGRLGIELRAVWLGGWQILKRLEENRYDLFSQRPAIRSVDKLNILLMALRKERFRRSHE